MRRSAPATLCRSRSRGVLGTLLTAGAMLTLAGAVLIVTFGVVATSGVYGSRMAWLLGAALPLLGLTILLSWSAGRASARVHLGPASGEPRRGADTRTLLLVTAQLLFGTPRAIAAASLFFYALVVVLHGIGLLR